MFETKTVVWPAYDAGQADHLHAIGVLVLAWNNIEEVYRQFFGIIIQGQFLNAAIRAFELMGNESRWQFIRDECSRVLDPEETEHVDHFLTCAAICKENRNAIAHATVLPTLAEAPALLSLRRGRNPGTGLHRDYHFPLGALRQMADETYATGLFGQGVARYALLRRLALPDRVREALEPLTLPDRPPLPRKWHLHSHANL